MFDPEDDTWNTDNAPLDADGNIFQSNDNSSDYTPTYDAAETDPFG